MHPGSDLVGIIHPDHNDVQWWAGILRPGNERRSSSINAGNSFISKGAIS
jgi:hypothetical protein